jgi:hypothetical protein
MKTIVLVGIIALYILYAVGAAPQEQPVTAAPPEHQEIEVQLDTPTGDYFYIAPPTISKGVYVEVICSHAGQSEICTAAPEMYDTIVAAGADPALELAHLNNESSYGTGGVGGLPWRNPHGVHGVDGARWGTPFYNGVEGDEIMQQYPTYTDAVLHWLYIIRDGGLYYPERNTPETVVERYCDCGGPEGKATYVAEMKALIDDWRLASQAAEQAPAPAQQPAAADQTERDKVIEIALSQVGKPYLLGTAGPTTFDCSGLVQWSYAQIGRATTRTTFSQLDTLPAIQPEQVQPGDLIYFQYPWDQHTGILADVDGDGTWDMIHAAAPGLGVIVSYNVFADAFYTDAIIGYRSAF